MLNSHNGNLEELAELMGKRNKVDERISEIIDRPAEKGHIFEYIASQIFPIKLNDSASKEGYDGTFDDGALKDKKVDVKYHAKNDHLLDLNNKANNETFLLVFTGPGEAASSSKGKVSPLRIDKIYLFNEKELCEQLAGKVKVGTATSVRSEYWEGKEIYPENKLNIDLKLKIRELKLLIDKINRTNL